MLLQACYNFISIHSFLVESDSKHAQPFLARLHKSQQYSQNKLLSASIAVNPIKISNFTGANLPTFYVHFRLAPNTYSCQIFQKLLLVLFQNTTHISQEFIIRQSPLKNIFYNFFYIPLLNFIPGN